MGRGVIKKETIDIDKTIEDTRKLIAEEPNLSVALKATIELLIQLILILAKKWMPRTSRNSSLPPAMDPNRKKEPKAKGKKKPGGQAGHPGRTLEPVEKPDKTEKILHNRGKLPLGKWKTVGFEKRQVIDLEIRRTVTEYQAEVVENERGERITAAFPEGVSQRVQYGQGVKSQSVYMTVQQMIPCERVAKHFDSQMDIPLSGGSVCNFKDEGSGKLEWFEGWVKGKLQKESVLNCDETGINIGGKRVWLHNASSELYTWYYPHERRGKEAMDEIGVIGGSSGILIHDHWKAYYSYEGKRHGLCNAHHLRELTGASEEGQKWAQRLADFLIRIKEKVEQANGVLDEKEQGKAVKQYRKLIREGEKECPEPEGKPPGKRGGVAKSRERNLLERLRDYEEDTLRFMTQKEVPFTNNLAERDIRMMKVQQKISGCFRSWEGAKAFCRIRSYISTCEKNGVSAADALSLLFNGQKPDFAGTEG